MTWSNMCGTDGCGTCGKFFHNQPELDGFQIDFGPFSFLGHEAFDVKNAPEK